jgi:hypothetical protein
MEEVRITFRVERENWEWLRDEAKKHRRSMNGQLNDELDRLRAEEKTGGDGQAQA